MDSWSYPSQGKDFVSDESISAPDGIGGGKNGLMDWDFKTQCCYKSSLVLTSEEAIENQGFVELGFPETMRKFWPENNFVKDVLSSKVGGERICTPTISTTNALSLEKESSSKFSSSVEESNSQDSSLIDLKLGRISDHRDPRDFRSSKAAPMLSSAQSSMLGKRVRASLSSQTPFCKVYGCKKDLSSSKDYHKRHKVCEVHSKTAKVIVNNIEQRFCQQCSRFHLLAEFDGDKRSCRKRLAGHNERRRKPHVGINSGRTGMLFQPWNGSRFQGSTLTSSSFICQDILPSNILHPQKYYTNYWSRHVKGEDAGDYCPQSAIPVTNGDLHPKSLFRHGFEKHSPPFHANGANLATGRDFNENSYHYPHDLGAPNSVSGAMIQNTTIRSEDFILFDSASNVHGLSGMSASDRAHSLLSSQSQNSSSHSSGIPMAQPLIISGSRAHYSASQVSGKLLGVSPQASINGVSNKLNSSWMNSVEDNHVGPILISDGIDAINFTDGIFQGSQYINSKDRLSCEDGPTIDLLQLSSQLQQVEHQRQSMQVKQGNDAFGGLKFTSAVQE